MDAYLSAIRATEYAVFYGVWMKVAIGLFVVVFIFGGDRLRDNTIMRVFLFLFVFFSVPYAL